MRFTEAEFSTLSNALRVAAERFDDDARVAGECHHVRLREQFIGQAAAARALYDRIAEEVGSVS